MNAKALQLKSTEETGKSAHVAAAINIRKILKAAFPGVKFSVRSESFSMGDAVRVSWTDGPTDQQVNDLIYVFEYGSFDGMTDSYDYDSGRDATYGGTKYISTSRNVSDERIKEVIAEGGEFEAPADIDEQIAKYRVGDLRQRDDHDWSEIMIQVRTRPAAQVAVALPHKRREEPKAEAVPEPAPVAEEPAMMAPAFSPEVEAVIRAQVDTLIAAGWAPQSLLELTQDQLAKEAGAVQIRAAFYVV